MADTRFVCAYPGCKRSYSASKSLSFHYRIYPEHCPDDFHASTKKTTAKKACDEFLGNSLADNTRSARLKEVISRLTEEEVIKLLLPRVAKSVAPWQFLLKASENSSGQEQSKYVAEYVRDTISVLSPKYPEVSGLLCTAPLKTYSATEFVAMATTENIVELLRSKSKQLCDILLQFENGKCFKDVLMPMVYSRYERNFIDFACGLVNSFGISQWRLQHVLRNVWGKDLANILGIKIIPPQKVILSQVHSRREEMLQAAGVHFNETDSLVYATVNIQKYLEYLLSQPMFDMHSLTPKNKLIVYKYTDLAPFLRWSWHYNGLTTTRLKVVDTNNLQSLIITTGAYLGEDTYENMRLAFLNANEELANLKHVWINSEKYELLVRGNADGKQRRLEVGNSTAMSSTPQVEAPEHRN